MKVEVAMTRSGGPRAKGLGAELRKHRESLGWSTRRVVAELEISRATYNRIELGHRDVAPEDLSAMLLVLGVKGTERERLLALAREEPTRSWLETGDGVPQQVRSLVAYEGEATRITQVAMTLVPGLLQTAEYARAAVAAGGTTVPDPDARIATRLGRQMLLSRPKPPEYRVLLDESVLVRPMGGCQVMVDQLRRVQKVAEKPQVTMQVMPHKIGGHPGCDGPYILLEFVRRSPMIYIEAKEAGVFLEDVGDVEPFVEASKKLVDQALDPEKSRAFIARVIDEMERSS